MPGEAPAVNNPLRLVVSNDDPGAPGNLAIVPTPVADADEPPPGRVNLPLRGVVAISFLVHGIVVALLVPELYVWRERDTLDATEIPIQIVHGMPSLPMVVAPLEDDATAAVPIPAEHQAAAIPADDAVAALAKEATAMHVTKAAATADDVLPQVPEARMARMAPGDIEAATGGTDRAARLAVATDVPVRSERVPAEAVRVAVADSATVSDAASVAPIATDRRLNGVPSPEIASDKGLAVAVDPVDSTSALTAADAVRAADGHGMAAGVLPDRARADPISEEAPAATPAEDLVIGAISSQRPVAAVSAGESTDRAAVVIEAAETAVVSGEIADASRAIRAVADDTPVDGLSSAPAAVMPDVDSVAGVQLSDVLTAQVGDAGDGREVAVRAVDAAEPVGTLQSRAVRDLDRARRIQEQHAAGKVILNGALLAPAPNKPFTD